MADFTITISDSLLVCGIERTTKYGTATFGTSKWTIGSHDLDTETIKLIANSLIPDSANLFNFIKLIDNSVTPAFETSNEGLLDGPTWNYTFAYPTTNAENRPTNTYTSGLGATTGWTSATAASPTWS